MEHDLPELPECEEDCSRGAEDSDRQCSGLSHRPGNGGDLPVPKDSACLGDEQSLSEGLVDSRANQGDAEDARGQPDTRN